MSLDEFPLKLCGFQWVEWESHFGSPECEGVEATCGLPVDHLGDHKMVVVYDCPQQPYGPVDWSKPWDGGNRLNSLVQNAYDALIQRSLHATPLARSLSTSGQTFGRPERARSAVLFTTTSTQAQPGASSTSSASPATPTETQ